MSIASESLFIDSALLRQAEQVCRQRLTKEPDNRAALRSLGEVCRKLGKLGEAAAAYGRLSDLDPGDHEAGYLQAVLGGKDWPVAPKGVRAAPFVLLNNFLPLAFHDDLMRLLISLRDKLTSALVGDDLYVPDHRETLDFMGNWEGRQRFKDHFKGIVPLATSRLFLAPFQIWCIEAYLRAYQDGHFFKTHIDAPTTSRRANRVMSFVYYFHRQPRPYTGGELLLFDTDVEDDKKYSTARFTCFVPEDNTLVVFPSRFYHCVLPVRCPSTDYADSRFVVNGFVHKAPPRLEEAAGAAGHRT